MLTRMLLSARHIIPAPLRRLGRRAVLEPMARRRAAAEFSRQMFDSYFHARTSLIKPVFLATGERYNFTYDLTERNLRYLAETVACVTRRPADEIAAYIAEAINDTALNSHIAAATAAGGGQHRPQLRSSFGRRLGWYAIARAMRPRVIVETGVERGHGSVLLSAALIRNGAEGHPGRYYGTDIDPGAGRFYTEPYSTVGRCLYGDSLTSLRELSETIDLFVNDSDHSAEYEYAEYCAIAGKLSAAGIVLGDNAHCTDKLSVFARETGRSFLFFKEEPADHWYPGAGIGIAFPRVSE
jgi:predicted O-methyltransferase YrrM